MNMRGKAQLEVFGPTAPRFEKRAVIKSILTHFRAVGPATAARIGAALRSISGGFSGEFGPALAKADGGGPGLQRACVRIQGFACWKGNTAGKQRGSSKLLRG
jgi:hypothetical protein